MDSAASAVSQICQDIHITMAVRFFVLTLTGICLYLWIFISHAVSVETKAFYRFSCNALYMYPLLSYLCPFLLLYCFVCHILSIIRLINLFENQSSNRTSMNLKNPWFLTSYSRLKVWENLSKPTFWLNENFQPQLKIPTWMYVFKNNILRHLLFHHEAK